MLKYKLFILFCFVFCCAQCEKIKVYEADVDWHEPCPCEELKCIRKQFITRGWCPRVRANYVKNGEFIVRDVITEMPYYNVTIVCKSVVFTGLEDANIVKFAINKVTDNTILSINFTDFHVKTDAKFYYHRQCDEDIVISTVTTEYYESVVVTTIIPKGYNGLAYSKSHATVPAMPPFSLGDCIEDVTNAEASALLAKFYTDPAPAIGELFITRAPILANYFIDYFIFNDCYGDNLPVPIYNYHCPQCYAFPTTY